MTRLTRTALTLATALVLAGAATTARADHDDRGRDRDRREPVVVTVPAPAPAYRVPPAPAPAYRPAPPWRTARWGGGRMQALRDDYRRLELSRDRFYASWNGNPGRRDRFEASYARHRAELDGRFADLEREHEHGRW
jgi:hypothetical protein